jgi:hypothetical protein
VLLRLLMMCQLESGGCGLVCGAHPFPHFGAENSRSGMQRLGWEATVKDYGVTVGEAAGVKPGASPVDRTPVNVGTAYEPFPVLRRNPAVVGWDRRDAGRRRRWGGAAVVLRAGESPCTWGRAAACQLRERM